MLTFCYWIEDARLLYRDEQPLESVPTSVRPSANDFETNPLVNDGESFALDSYGKYCRLTLSVYSLLVA